MKMTMNKVSRAALAGLMVCGLALSAAPALNAAPETVRATAVSTLPDKVTVQINKKHITADYEMKENTGETIPGLDSLAGLKGIKFTAYDVTAAFYKLQAKDENQGKTAKELVNMIIANWANDKSDTVKLETKETDKDGLIDFANLKTRTDEKKYKLYLFEEEYSGRTDLLRSAPMIVGMPVRDSTGNKFLDTIKIYPKNTGLQKDLTNLNDKTQDNIVYSYEVGQELEYTTNLVIPNGLMAEDSKYETINLTDMMDKRGTTLVGKPKITLKDSTTDLHDLFVAAGAYTDSNGANWNGHAGFKYAINLKDEGKQTQIANLLEKIEGKALKISYTMQINNEATPNQEIGNTFTGKFGNDPSMIITDDAQKVETSGHMFRKYDAYDEAHGLKGATFKIKNSDDKWAIFEGLLMDGSTYKPNDITWTTDKDKASEVKSGEDGYFQVHGLQAGTYYLEEIAAPTGYTTTKELSEFTVADGIVEGLDLGSDDIANTPLDGELPLTGGMGIAAFLIVGTAAMGTAVIYKKRHA